MGDGWVKSHRELQQHPVWSHDGMLKLWMHCIFEANYKPSKYLVPGTTETIEVARGSFVTGREKLRSSLYPSTNADTPCSRTIYRWLESLEKMGCVTLVTVSHRCTVVSVCNYDTYQSPELGQCPSDVQVVSKSCPADVPPMSTSEEGKNERREEGKNINTPPNPQGGKGGKKSATEFEVSIPETLNTPEFVETWGLWLKFRKEKREPVTETSAFTQMRKFVEWGVDRAVAAMNHTILMGWTGLKEPDQQSFRQQPDLFSGIRDFAKRHETEGQ